MAVLSWLEAEAKGMPFKEWQELWFQSWIKGEEIEQFSCGCTGQLRDGKLLIKVKLGCPFDASKIGRVERTCRYIPQEAWR